jgi:hypothetical protein
MMTALCFCSCVTGLWWLDPVIQQSIWFFPTITMSQTLTLCGRSVQQVEWHCFPGLKWGKLKARKLEPQEDNSKTQRLVSTRLTSLHCPITRLNVNCRDAFCGSFEGATHQQQGVSQANLQNGKIDLLHQSMVFSPGPTEYWDKSSWLDHDKHDLWNNTFMQLPCHATYWGQVFFSILWYKRSCTKKIQ